LKSVRHIAFGQPQPHLVRADSIALRGGRARGARVLRVPTQRCPHWRSSPSPFRHPRTLANLYPLIDLWSPDDAAPTAAEVRDVSARHAGPAARTRSSKVAAVPRDDVISVGHEQDYRGVDRVGRARSGEQFTCDPGALAGARHHQMAARQNEVPGQQPDSGAYLGFTALHPQRGSNPCLHLERVVS
jgi:hypothetical protein